jgi:hypothetical protein
VTFADGGRCVPEALWSDFTPPSAAELVALQVLAAAATAKRQHDTIAAAADSGTGSKVAKAGTDGGDGRAKKVSSAAERAAGRGSKRARTQ